MRILTSALAALALAGPAAAGNVDWSKAGAAAALETAPLWTVTAGQPGWTSPFHVDAIVSLHPYGHTRVAGGKIRAAEWDAVVTFTVHHDAVQVSPSTTVPASTARETDRLCVIAEGPVRTRPPYTSFAIGGWSVGNATLGGCAAVGRETTDGGDLQTGASLAWGTRLGH